VTDDPRGKARVAITQNRPRFETLAKQFRDNPELSRAAAAELRPA
jgi:hypothetical protein